MASARWDGRREAPRLIARWLLDRIGEEQGVSLSLDPLDIANYGDGIEGRLTGLHETCSHSGFRWGGGDRGASIRIPVPVARAGRGYLEDRRPCANIDPYVVTRLLLEAVWEESVDERRP